LAGFFAKFYVFLAAIKAGLFTLAVIGVLSSVVGAYYYLAIVKIMYFDEPVKGFQRMPVLFRLVLGGSGSPISSSSFISRRFLVQRRWLRNPYFDANTE